VPSWPLEATSMRSTDTVRNSQIARLNRIWAITIIRGIQTAVVGLLGAILIAAIIPATDQDAIAPPEEIAAPFHPACARWDEAASDALARLVHDRNDVAARQLGDALFRLRRARKNCSLGWLVVACQDYRAILDSAGGRGVAPVPACAAALIE
jgi:Zn-dependent protease with chaperone function